MVGSWQTSDLGVKPGWDEWESEFKKKMSTPKIVDRFMEWTLAPSCRRKTDEVRAYREAA